MRRKNNSSELIGGQDSFLDIVANLVGILIILVVVVGAQATSAKKEMVDTQDLDQEMSQKQVLREQAEQNAHKMTIDNHQLEQDISEEKFLAKRLADERHAKLMRLEMVKRELDRRTQDWNDFEKEVFAKTATIDSLKQQLTNVHAKMKAWQHEEVFRVETIEHFPTPIAKTVFMDEIHFRMSNGKITYVPMEELLDSMKAQWKVVADNLERSDQAIETVGPIDGYRLRYELRKRMVSRETRDGLVRGQAVEFDHFVILPTGEREGETLNVALNAGSEFASRLADREPGRTTVSIWVYPESYGEFMVLKKELHQLGYQVASWPLDEGRPISGGPNGFKTSAQ
jgi:hypothetical protein